VNASAQFLNPSAAAQRLGVSAKALRLYEQHGLVTPRRTAAGWRAYGPDEIARAAEIIALRSLGLSIAQIARVLQDDGFSAQRVRSIEGCRKKQHRARLMESRERQRHHQHQGRDAERHLREQHREQQVRGAARPGRYLGRGANPPPPDRHEHQE